MENPTQPQIQMELTILKLVDKTEIAEVYPDAREVPMGHPQRLPPHDREQVRPMQIEHHLLDMRPHQGAEAMPHPSCRRLLRPEKVALATVFASDTQVQVVW